MPWSGADHAKLAGDYAIARQVPPGRAIRHPVNASVATGQAGRHVALCSRHEVGSYRMLPVIDLLLLLSAFIMEVVSCSQVDR